MSLEPTWRFRRMGRDELGVDPVQPARHPKGAGEEEFFTTEELGDLNGVLVREAIQNLFDTQDADGKSLVERAGHYCRTS